MKQNSKPKEYFLIWTEYENYIADSKEIAEETVEYSNAVRPSETTVVHVIEKSAYDKLKAAYEKAIEQRNKRVANNLMTMPGLNESDDAELAKILEGVE